MTTEPNPSADAPADITSDVTSPGDPLSTGQDAPSSGSFTGGGDSDAAGGTATGDPLAGVGRPEEPPAYPEGSDDSLDA